MSASGTKQTCSMRRRMSASGGKAGVDNTSWYGKNHNTPPYTESQVGPFDGHPCTQICLWDREKPMDGISMAYTWDAKPDDPTRHKVQYSAMKYPSPAPVECPSRQEQQCAHGHDPQHGLTESVHVTLGLRPKPPHSQQLKGTCAPLAAGRRGRARRGPDRC
jgi:hypothetical protein